VPAFAGTAIEVAVPDALVIVAPAAKVVVPAGANQTAFDASPLLRMPRVLVPRATAQLAGKTKSCVETSAVGRMARYVSWIPEPRQVAYCVAGHTLSATATGGSIVLFGGFTPILFTVAYVRRIVRSCFAP